MDKIKEIETRKAELRELLEGDGEVDLDAIKEELDKLDKELEEIKKQLESAEKPDNNADEENENDNVAKETAEQEDAEREERKKIAEAISNKTLNNVKVLKKEEKRMKNFGLDSAEYRSAWAKKIMGLSDDKFTEDEKRALGDAITTTATTYVASTESVQGINNGGLLIPTSIRQELLALIEKNSPFFRDILKIAVRGNVDLPWLDSSDDASWVAEDTATTNEGMEFKRLQLTGRELVKNVVITWKLEEMAVESFISFITSELAQKMGRAICNGVLYGRGASYNEPNGVTNGLSAISGNSVFDLIKAIKETLDDDAKVGAKCYISGNVSDAITFYKDANNNYPYLAGLPRIANLEVETDPFLKDNDIVIGNPKNYVFNEETAIRVDREVSVKTRKVTYGGYAILDGGAKNGAFAYGKLASV